MKYQDKYPNAEKWFRPEHTSIMKGSSEFSMKSCWNCGELTDWIDICFEAHLCSEECSEAKWKEFQEAFDKYEEMDVEV